MADPAVFLDRDGTVIVEKEYLSKPEGVEFVPGAPAAIARLRDAGFRAVIVTNQAGIARGYYTVDDYRSVARRVDELLAAEGVSVDGTYFCPHHPDFTGECGCRKPGTDLYRRAAEEIGLDLARSYYVGDKLSDVVPALELGGRGILVRSGYGTEEESRAPEGVTVADDLVAAADWIIDKTRR